MEEFNTVWRVAWEKGDASVLQTGPLDASFLIGSATGIRILSRLRVIVVSLALGWRLILVLIIAVIRDLA